VALYRKYRPATFAEVVGQEHVTEPLSTALSAGRINHAYLFSGPRGCGKTSSARILARSLNCEQGPTPAPCGTCDSCVALAPNGPGNMDVTELDAAEIAQRRQPDAAGAQVEGGRGQRIAVRALDRRPLRGEFGGAVVRRVQAVLGEAGDRRGEGAHPRRLRPCRTMVSGRVKRLQLRVFAGGQDRDVRGHPGRIGIADGRRVRRPQRCHPSAEDRGAAPAAASGFGSCGRAGHNPRRAVSPTAHASGAPWERPQPIGRTPPTGR
jgi:DNA polymerase III delta prime subunit